MRFKFHIAAVRCFVLIAFSAILSGASSPAFFNSNKQSSTTMVYCPLTKKLQPINPSSVVSDAFSLNEICAADSEKFRLTAAISENLKFAFTNLNLYNLENLAFDFWQKGEAAFDVLPNTPKVPEKSAVKSSFSTTGFGGGFDFKIVWKTSERFAFQTQPRPPTEIGFPEFNCEVALELKRLFRLIAPRAPPVFV